MNGQREIKQLFRELERAGFEIVRRRSSYKVWAPGEPGSQRPFLFMACTPQDRRAIDNNRSWAEKHGLPKKNKN